MLVARLSFVAEYDGRRHAVNRGTTRVSEDHELARRFPNRFEPVGPEDRMPNIVIRTCGHARDDLLLAQLIGPRRHRQPEA